MITPFLRKFVVCLILIKIPCELAVADERAYIEKRVMLDEAFSWLRPEQAEQVLDKVKRSGFNIFMPVVWHGRGVTWKSDLAYKEPLWKQGAIRNQDALKILIEKAHEKGVEVHPWFTIVLRQRNIFPDFFDQGTPKKAFNIHVNEFRDFIIELVLDVVENYSIDGINLDYIRSMGICDSAFCVSDYYKKNKRNLLVDIKIQKNNAIARASIAEWNERAVTDIVRRISFRAREIRPGLFISVDTHPIHRRLYVEGANSIKWANLGYIDMIYDMQYKRKLNVGNFKEAKARLKDSSKIALMIGNFERSEFKKSQVWSRDYDRFIEHVEKAIDLGKESKSIAVYQYPYLSDEQITALRNGPLNLYAK